MMTRKEAILANGFPYEKIYHLTNLEPWFVKFCLLSHSHALLCNVILECRKVFAGTAEHQVFSRAIKVFCFTQVEQNVSPCLGSYQATNS
jgi:hypothetical protein